METPLLPLEIETEILLRLPAKSLQRFTTVCKLWHSIITSSSFISSYNHLNSPLSSSKLLLLKHPFPHPLLPSSLTTIHFSLSSSDSFLESSIFKVPQDCDSNDDNDCKLKPTRVELVTSDSINGVVCVLVYMGSSNGYDENCDLFLWNPSTSESLKIPSSEESGLFSGAPMVKFYCGFGSCCSGDYKVVRVVYLQSVIPIVEVYSLKLNSWKKLGCSSHSRILSNTLWASSTCVFVDGVGYWGAFNRERKDSFCVLGFEFEGELFKRIRVPTECVDGGEMRYHNLWVYDGMLAISVLRFGDFESNITRHYIWVMRGVEGSDLVNWVNVFNIDLEGGLRKPIACLGNGEVLLLGEIDGEHALYDTVTEEVKSVDIFDVDDVVTYTESLVSFSKLMPQVTV